MRNEHKSVAAAVGKLADVETKRFEALQKTGLYDDAELGEALEEQARQAGELEQGLRELVEKFPETKSFVLNLLRKVFRPDEFEDPEVLPGEIV